MIDRLYKQGYRIRRLTDTVDSGGAVNEDVDTDSTNWPISTYELSGHLRQLSAHERMANGKVEVYATHRFYCPASTDITAEDRLTDPDSNEYTVLTVENPHNLDKFLQVDLERRT